MTPEYGIGLRQSKAEPHHHEDFIRFLRALRRKWGQTPLALMMDNASIHKGDVRPFYDKFNIKPIWNVGYSPEFNAIEAVFSKVKALYNRQRLNCLVNKTFFKS